MELKKKTANVITIRLVRFYNITLSLKSSPTTFSGG